MLKNFAIKRPVLYRITYFQIDWKKVQKLFKDSQTAYEGKIKPVYCSQLYITYKAALRVWAD